MRAIPMLGRRFNRLAVVSAGPQSNDNHKRFWCRCDCGADALVLGSQLRSGQTKSCGCWRSDTARAVNRTHGEARPQTAEYVIWAAMIARCENKKADNYPRYGGRGITVCKRWRTSYAAFLADMGRRPSPDHSIDRINNERGYMPSNCRWATVDEQRHNRRAK